VLLAEIVAMFVWISLKGLSAPAGSPAGPLYRSLITSVLLGLVAFLVVRKAVKGDGAGPQRTRAIVVTIAVVLGLVLGRAWAGKGIEYSSNLLNWVQNASALMLIGGLRGLVTRFTLWVALLGASLATSKGKHINIDVVMRAVPVKARAAVAIVGWTAASLMCFGAAAGFSDFIAVTKSQFGAPVEVDCPGEESKPQGQRQQCATTAGSKMAHVKREMGHDMFLLGRQISLDFKTLPKVLGGTKYDGWLGAQEWNAWLKDSEPDWVARFGKEEYERKLLPPDLATKQVPATPVLGERERAGLLIRTTNFIFPLGFIMLGLRFLLRVLLVLSGHIRVDPDAVHEDEDLKHAHDGEPQKGGA
jgi:TRAP-type C4-dicarboxylate transport system permease small subunit